MDFRPISEPLPLVAMHMVHPGERLSSLALNSPEDAVAYMRGQLAPCVVEHMVLVAVEPDLRPVSQYLIAKGCKDHAEFSLADLARAALLTGAETVMIFHNHASGGIPVPSKADLMACRRIYNALSMVGIHLLDFFIISSDEKYISFSQEQISVFSSEKEGEGTDAET